MLEIFTLLLVFASINLIIFGLPPLVIKYYHRLQERKVEAASKKLENLFVDIQRKKLASLFFLSPIILCGAGILFFRHLLVGIIAAMLGFVLPNLLIKYLEKKRIRKIDDQLIDCLVILSGCLKAGLSLLQSLEVLVEDIPPPISQEFALVIKEVKMGITLEEGLMRLGDRVGLQGLTLIINSITVAGVSGGDLVKVFSRLITTLRNSHKLQDNIRTLTLQGRMQGIILSVLPFIFTWWVLTFNRQYFSIMFSSEKGRMLMFIAAGLQLLGLYLIRRFSIIKI